MKDEFSNLGILFLFYLLSSLLLIIYKKSFIFFENTF